MTRPEVKDRERAALDFLLQHGGTGVEVTRVDAGEAPDFVLTLANESRVGVEVVELGDPSVARGMAGFGRFKSTLLAALARAGLKVIVTARTRDGFIPKFNEKAVLKSHVAGVIALVRDHQAAGRSREVYQHEPLRDRGAGFVIELTIDPSGGPAVVTAAEQMSFGLSNLVQQRVDAKKAKLQTYREAVGGPVWLLLVAGVRFASGIWSEAVKARTLRSDFDRVFYVDAYDGAAFEVEIEPTRLQSK